MVDEIVSRLENAGWDKIAARKIADLNRDAFDILLEEHPSGFERALSRLDQLGNYPAMMLTLRAHPELATLFANVGQSRKMDNMFNKMEIHEACYGIIASAFQIISEPTEQSTLTDTLMRHGRKICELGQQGIPAPYAYFMFDHMSSGAEEYALWLEEVVGQALVSQNSEERLPELIAFIAAEGNWIRDRMRKDDAFRQGFRSRAWPAFIRVTDCENKTKGECDTAFEFIGGERGVWDLLLLDKGEELLDRAGLLAVELMVGSQEPAPIELHPIFQEALLEGNDAIVSPLIRYQGEPLLRQAMARRDITPDLRSRMLAELEKKCPASLNHCPSLDSLLTSYVTLTPPALREQLAAYPDGLQTWIPFYSTYYLGKKIIQGRPIETTDIVFATLDAVTIVTLAGTGAKTLVQESTTKAIGKSLKRKAGAKLGPKGLKQLDRLLLQRSEVYARNKTQLQSIMKPFGIAGSTELVNIDVTKPVQWTFRKTGVGRESFKKLSGLEARVFMRRDRRIVVLPNQGVLGVFLRETAENAAADSAVDAWSKHASSLWLAQAAGVM
ncbi:MAG: hypothetical protein HQL48_07425 [Gammaproteobacteria bacterium]|nr:hypothetical protein [Gammaproteobacteria bacterium]